MNANSHFLSGVEEVDGKWERRRLDELVLLSYAYKVKGREDVPCFGSAVVDDGEHPIEKVNRWNEMHDDRHTVLIYFCLMNSKIEHDVEIGL